ncbi:protein of unknown function [Sterolibacterium denitrificans]|uniref:Uncharacterized protein n=1 Tax=Sterolibacterium denitrificans TaxID=157592 RepID=A0A7Z7MVJ7_9PROT|nr:hypothetical protein [Sterolibacterium denitrificans]SMB27810.1 protein of unknown function [Sterolibacterium denitrificans]
MSHYLGHPQDRDLRMLRSLARSIETQLELEHQLSERDRREIDLAACFPAGKMILRGSLADIRHTIDPEVMRCHVVQDGRLAGTLYINLLRKKCTPVDCLTAPSLPEES